MTNIKTLAARVDDALDTFENAARAYVTEARRLDKASREPGRMETPEFAHALPRLHAAVNSRLARLTESPRDQRYRSTDGPTLPLPNVRKVAQAKS